MVVQKHILQQATAQVGTGAIKLRRLLVTPLVMVKTLTVVAAVVVQKPAVVAAAGWAVIPLVTSQITVVLVVAVRVISVRYSPKV